MLGSKEQRTEGIRRQAQELIDKAYECGFRVGYDQRAIDKKDALEKAESETYQRGLDDAWECADKLNRMTIDEVRRVFASDPFGYTIERECIFSCCTPALAIAKIRQYEEQKKAESEKIKVGDEVIHSDTGTKAVVLDFVGDNERIMVYDENGFAEDWRIIRVRKTGRTFPQIAEVLKQLQEGEE